MSKDVYIKKTIEDLKERQDQLTSELVETRNCIATLERMVSAGEQEENNPDRPGTTRKKKVKMIWVCKKCGVEYKSEPKLGCLNYRGDDFREVLGGGD